MTVTFISTGGGESTSWKPRSLKPIRRLKATSADFKHVRISPPDTQKYIKITLTAMLSAGRAAKRAGFTTNLPEATFC